MYRVTDNPRSKKTAALICDGLEKCLETKPLGSIHVKDIFEQCYVSRSTFYRLFDSIIDVLIYQCDCIMKERARIVKDMTFKNKTERALYCIGIWLAHPRLIKAIVDNNLGWILLQTHLKNQDYLQSIYPFAFEDKSKYDYFASILSSVICGALFVYFKHGEENIADAYKNVVESINAITAVFAPNE